MITIIDYGVGNLNSVANIINHVGNDCIISSDPMVILNSTKLILPGVGSFDNGIIELSKRGIIEALNEAVLVKKIPILGICLGMQLMTLRSEEGQLDGLGWIDAEVLKFDFEPSLNLKIPHMGWNQLNVKNLNPLFVKTDQELRFYFVHSYFVKAHIPNDIIATSIYGDEFCVAFQKDNIFGVQFHPEKSHRFGMSLIHNFISL
jgi:glutamine amidotransferase